MIQGAKVVAKQQERDEEEEWRINKYIKRKNREHEKREKRRLKQEQRNKVNYR